MNILESVVIDKMNKVNKNLMLCTIILAMMCYDNNRKIKELKGEIILLRGTIDKSKKGE